MQAFARSTTGHAAEEMRKVDVCAWTCREKAGPSQANAQPSPHLSTDCVAAVGMQLFSHREDVDALNAAQLAALPGDGVRFAAQDDGRSPDALQAACLVRRSLFGVGIRL